MMIDKLNSPACLAIRAWLVEHKGTRAQIEEATGYCESTVEKCVTALRRAGEPEFRNVLRARIGAPTQEKRVRRTLEVIEAEREAADAAARRLTAATVVSIALARRTPLEQAWGAQA